MYMCVGVVGVVLPARVVRSWCFGVQIEGLGGMYVCVSWSVWGRSRRVALRSSHVLMCVFQIVPHAVVRVFFLIMIFLFCFVLFCVNECDDANEATKATRRAKRRRKLGAGLQARQEVVFVQHDERVAFLIGHLITGVFEINHLITSLHGERFDDAIFASLTRTRGDDGAAHGFLLRAFGEQDAPLRGGLRGINLQQHAITARFKLRNIRSARTARREATNQVLFLDEHVIFAADDQVDAPYAKLAVQHRLPDRDALDVRTNRGDIACERKENTTRMRQSRCHRIARDTERASARARARRRKPS